MRSVSIEKSIGSIWHFGDCARPRGPLEAPNAPPEPPRRGWEAGVRYVARFCRAGVLGRGPKGRASRQNSPSQPSSTIHQTSKFVNPQRLRFQRAQDSELLKTLCLPTHTAKHLTVGWNLQPGPTVLVTSTSIDISTKLRLISVVSLSIVQYMALARLPRHTAQTKCAVSLLAYYR